jgi:hypothetical protein
MPEDALTFENGLYEGQEPSLLPIGMAAKLENWVPEPNGSLRCRGGWNRASTVGLPATRRARGFGSLKLNYRRSAVTRVQYREASGTGTSPSASWPSPTTAGNLLVLVVTTALQDVFADPSGWTFAASSGSPPANQVRIFYKQNAASQSGAASLPTFASSTDWVVYLIEYSGIATAGALDQGAGTGGASASPSTGTTAVTTQDAELWLGVISDESAEVHSSPTNGFSIVDQIQNGAGNSTVLLERSAAGRATASSSTTTATSNSYNGAIATFKAALLTPAAYLLVAHDVNGASFAIYRTDDDLASAFSVVETVAVTDTSQPVAFAQGLGGVVYTHPDFATARRWDGSTVSAITDAPAGRAITFHLSRFWIGGTVETPSRLYFSKVGDHTDWISGGGSDDAGHIDVGLDDGDAIESVAVFEDGLLIAKGSSLWFLSGSTTADFAVTPLNGGGSARGKTVCPTPFGMVIAGTHNVWLWTGGGVESVSEGVEQSYEITGFATAAYVDHCAYICDSGTGLIFVLNLQTGTWYIESVSGEGEGPAIVMTHGGYLMFGPDEATANSLIQYRDHPAEERVRDPSEQTFVLWTPEYRFGGVARVVTPRRLKIAVRQRGEGDMPLTITPYYDGEAALPVEIAPREIGTFVERLGVGDRRGVEKVQFRITHTVEDDCLMDIEAMSLEYELTER